MLIAGGISIYANVAFQLIERAEDGTWMPRRDPHLDAMALAAAAPILLWATLEVLIRVEGRGLAAWTVRVGTTLVAAASFIASFQNIRNLLLSFGDSQLTGWTYPLGIDGALVAAAAALWQIRVTATAAPAAAVGEAPAVEAPRSPAEPRRRKAAEPLPAAAPTEAPTTPAVDPAPVPAAAPTPPPAPRPRAVTARPAAAVQPDTNARDARIRALAAEGNGRPTVARTLRDEGYSISDTDLATMLRQLRAETEGRAEQHA
jgi:hypothetical protein